MIGSRFAEKREALGLTQKELAEKLGVGQSLIGQIETGLKVPSVMVVKLAAEFFGCTTDELILGRKSA